MSNTNQEAVLPDYGAAYSFLEANLYDDAFFNKIAAVTGIVLQNEIEKQKLRKWAQQLRQANELDREMAKSASGGSLIDQGMALTEQYLLQQGVSTGQDDEDAFLRKVAAAAGQDLSVQAAFLAMASAELEGNQNPAPAA